MSDTLTLVCGQNDLCDLDWTDVLQSLTKRTVRTVRDLTPDIAVPAVCPRQERWAWRFQSRSSQWPLGQVRAFRGFRCGWVLVW